jgi:hypothetical protein
MYKISIPFTDFLGNEHEKEYQFNLTESELLELEYKTDGRLRKTLEALSNGSTDTVDLAGFFAMFIKAAYGEISADGITFDKDETVWNKFYRSNAYNNLFMQVMTNDEAAINLINGAMPKQD